MVKNHHFPLFSLYGPLLRTKKDQKPSNILTFFIIFKKFRYLCSSSLKELKNQINFFSHHHFLSFESFFHLKQFQFLIKKWSKNNPFFGLLKNVVFRILTFLSTLCKFILCVKNFCNVSKHKLI